ncbi:MAG: PepSY domain-containing protein [Intestinimonas sp.]
MDEDDGRWIYEAKLRHGDLKYEIELDAFTGEILRVGRGRLNASRSGAPPVGPAP